MQRFMTLALACLISLGSAGTAFAGEKLTTRAIKKLFPGQFHAVIKGYKVYFNAKRDGSLVGSYLAKSDTGRWSVRRGRLCIMLRDWTDGKTSCSRVVQAGNWYRASDVKFRKL